MNMPVNLKKRLTYLDSAGGLLLIYMIVGHCAQWAVLWNDFDKYTYWLGFFMPWFFFKGGIFYKPKTFREELKSGYKRLIVPFICFSLIGTVILWVKLLIINGDISIKEFLYPIKGLLIQGSVPGNLALWFLPSLFAVRIIFNYFYNLIINSRYPIMQLIEGGGIYDFKPFVHTTSLLV